MQPTATTQTLKIDGMSGEPCVQKVKAALGTVAGLTTEAVAVGTATIRFTKPEQVDAARGAISGAGFKSAPSATSTLQPSSTPAAEPAVASAGAPATPVAM